MFEKRAQGLALIAPAALFSAIVFLAPVIVLLAQGFQVEGHASLAPLGAFSPRRSIRRYSGAR